MLPLFLILLIIIVPLTFSPCLQAQYLHWDDFGHFISNPCVYPFSWGNVLNIFGQTINETYIPLTTLSFNLEYHFFGFSAFVSHLVNIILHLAVVLAIFEFALKLEFSPWEAFVACLIFAVHPMHVESVAWVTERKDVLGILFYVICLSQYWSYLQKNSKGHYFWSLIFGVLSVLTKSMAVSLPWVLFLLDWFYKRKWSKRSWLDKFPFAILIFSIAAITVFKLSPHPKLVGNSILVGLWTFSFYLDKFFFPFTLTPVYIPPLPVVLFNMVYLKSLVIFMVFWSLFYLGRRNRLYVFSCLFWVATIFIFWRFNYFDNNIVADRFMYLPSLGICLFLGKYLSKFKALCVVVLVFLGFLTFMQTSIWRGDLSLWTWTLQQDPNNLIARDKLDEAIYDARRTGFDAIRIKALSEAIDKNPHDARLYIKRGQAYLTAGDNFFAFGDFSKAIKTNPQEFEDYNMRGQLYLLKLEFNKALEDFNKAIALNPNNPTAYVEKALILALMHDTNHALIYFGKAILIKPPMGGAYFERGLLYGILNKHQQAIDDFSQSILLKNNLQNSYYQRAKNYEALNQLDLAVADLKRALNEDPYDVKSLDDLGIVYIKQKDFDKAVQVLNKAILLHPYNGNSYYNRGVVYLQKKQYDLALKDFTSDIQLELYPYHALITRGDLYLAFGHKKLAQEDYKRAILYSNGDTLASIKYKNLLLQIEAALK